MMVTSKYFDEKEFNRCTPRCSLQQMQQQTIDKLDMAREIARIPFVLTSAYRSSRWDVERGRSGTGAHTLGMAVDIRCNASDNRFAIIYGLLMAGFSRIGIDKGFIHADDSPQHTQRVVWLY